MRTQVVVVFVVLFLAEAAQGNLVGYVAQGADIYWTDFDTGEQVLLPLNGLSDAVDYFESFAFSGADGCLYAVGHWRSYLTVGGRQIERSLYKIDPASGNVTNNVAFLSASHGLSRLPDMAITPDGTPYAFEENPNLLYALVEPPDAGAYIGVTYIGQASYLSAIAIDNSGQAIIWGGSLGKLHWLDLTDASISVVGDIGGDFSSLHYGPDGMLYAWGNRTLYEIDVDNLAATDLGSFSLGDSPFAIVPEPATLLLLGFGAVMMGRRGVRKAAIC